jgi:diaminohydroxyphosphoribosylaminopyrimidine deaminase / 5-amino-6-(5-phosphoribosylamino)uracil reductase
METHELYMKRCLDLAVKGFGHVAPNPMVGSVIVHNNQIIGEGYHQQFGKAHAEVNAINSIPVHLKHLLSQSTLYVSLEPCSHHGKTPPCADLIVSKKIPNVVIASNDPNPYVSGNGIKKLLDAGIEVTTGVLKKDADFLNRRFMTFHTKHRPYIILKWAESEDGFMAPNEPRQVWLTNQQSKKLVHQWRSEEQAIMVGKNTVMTDDPELTVRLVDGNNPARVIIDKKLMLPLSQKIYHPNAPVYVYNELKDQKNGYVHYEQIDLSQPVLPQILKSLTAKHIQSIIVEGGPATLQHFVDENLWDEARVFTAPVKLVSGKPSPKLPGSLFKEDKIGDDRLKVLLNAGIHKTLA